MGPKVAILYVLGVFRIEGSGVLWGSLGFSKRSRSCFYGAVPREPNMASLRNIWLKPYALIEPSWALWVCLEPIQGRPSNLLVRIQSLFGRRSASSAEACGHALGVLDFASPYHICILLSESTNTSQLHFEMPFSYHVKATRFLYCGYMGLVQNLIECCICGLAPAIPCGRSGVIKEPHKQVPLRVSQTRGSKTDPNML